MLQFPERIYRTPSAATSLDFSKAHPNLLAVRLMSINQSNITHLILVLHAFRFLHKYLYVYRISLAPPGGKIVIMRICWFVCS